MFNIKFRVFNKYKNAFKTIKPFFFRQQLFLFKIKIQKKEFNSLKNAFEKYFLNY